MKYMLRVMLKSTIYIIRANNWWS